MGKHHVVGEMLETCIDLFYCEIIFLVIGGGELRQGDYDQRDSRQQVIIIAM